MGRVGMPFEEIVALFERRRTDMGPVIAAATNVIETYNGDLVVPLPELDRDERAAVPNLLNMGLNQLAMRIASYEPDVYFPPENPGLKRSEKTARIRRQATIGWWERSALDVMGGRRARHLLGFASTVVALRPDFDLGVPRWQLCHPLHSFPGATTNPDDVELPDIIFTYQRTLAWMQANYRDAFYRLSKGRGWTPDDKVTLLEYADADEQVMGVIGKPRMPEDGTANGVAEHVEVLRLPNRAGRCIAVQAGRVTLDRRQGAFDSMVGLFQMQAKLMALEAIAVRQGIFPNEWIVSKDSSTIPKIIVAADGKRGVIGVAAGGEIHTQALNPGYKTDQTIGMLERAQRLEGGIPAEFGGESTTNVRTGRRGDAILSAVVNFPVQEAQRVLGRARAAENQVAIAIAKGYFGSRQVSLYVSRKNAKGSVSYIANRDFTSDTNVVSYAHAGADINDLVIGLGQRLGTGIMSKHTAQRLDPLIDDPEEEHDRTVAEALETAVLGALTQGAASGAIPVDDVNRIAEMVITDRKSLFEAIAAQQRAAQERQASSGPPGTPTGPVPVGAPEAQPGMALPGVGAEQPTIGPTANESGLNKLLLALRGPAMGASGA